MNNPTAIPKRRFALVAAAGLALAAVIGPHVARAADEEKKEPAKPVVASGESRAEEKVMLFNGKDLSGWKLRDAKHPETWKVVSSVKLDAADQKKLVGEGAGGGEGAVLFRQPIDHGSDVYTEKSFGSGHYHVEFMVPKGSNSGVYLMGLYEIQVLDSHGKQKVGPGDVGGLYNTKAASENAAKAPGEWQTFDIVFKAPQFDEAGKKVSNALFVNVKLNGKTIHENVEAPKPTGGELGGEKKAEGPLMFQGDHGIVAFRNVWVQPMLFRAAGEAEKK